MKDKLHKTANRKFQLWYLAVLAILIVVAVSIVSTSCSDVTDKETLNNSNVSSVVDDTVSSNNSSVNEEVIADENSDKVVSSTTDDSVSKPQSGNTKPTIVPNKNNVISNNNRVPEVNSPSISDNNNNVVENEKDNDKVEDNNKDEVVVPDESDKEDSDDKNDSQEPDGDKNQPDIGDSNQPDEGGNNPPECDDDEDPEVGGGEDDDEVIPETPTLNLIPQGGRLVLNGTTYIGDGVSVEWPDMSDDPKNYKDTTFTYRGLTYKIYYTVPTSENLGMGWILGSRNFSFNLLSSIPTEWNGIAVTGMQNTFQGNTATEYPEIPNHIFGLNRTYASSQIMTLPIIPNEMKGLYYTFSGCANLTTIPNGWELPESVENISGAFQNCTSLTGTLVINGHPTIYRNAFQGVDFGLQNLTISHNCDDEDCDLVDKLMATGKNTVNPTTLSMRQSNRSLPSFSFVKLFKFIITIPTRIKLFF